MSEILLTEQLASSVTPTAGRVVIYAKTDGYLYFKDDTGVETRVNMQVTNTAAGWTSTNPTLAEGVIGVETDTMKFKIGDGVTAWNTLAYWRYTAEHLVINTTGGTTVLTLAQVRASSFEVTGALTSNANIVVQDIMALFVAENLTSGAYTVTFKTAAGAGVVVPQGAHVTLYADGVDVEVPATAGIGSGDVVGPASSASGKVALFSGTTGKLLSDSGVTLGTAAASATTDFEPANANIQSHIGSTSNPHSVTKTQVGLGNADNTSDVNKPVSTAQASADTTAENNAKAYADTLVLGLWDDRGAYDASVNTFPASGGSGTAGAVLKGDIWSVSVAGTLGGVAVGIGDTVRALADTPGQTASNWALQENNIGYVPENVANKVTSISGASTDTQYPSAKLAYDQLALKAPLNAPTFTGTVGGITAAMVGAPSGSGTSSGTNTGDQASIVGITGTLAQFNTAVTDADLLGTTGVGSDLTLARIAGSTYSTIQHWRNNLASAGVVSGGVMSDAGGATINVTGGSCAIRPTTSHTSTLYFSDFPANNGIAIPANTIRYVGVEYNAGSPVVAIRATDDFDYMTNFPIGVVTNEAGVLHLHTSDRHDMADSASHIAERMEHTATFARDEVIGGLILGETGTRNITMSAGAMWQKLVKLTITAFNSSTGGTFDIYYRDGASSFTKVAAATQWPNTQYDDGTGTLATLANNKFGVLWFYLEADDSDIIMVYGRVEHGSIAAAEAEVPPATVPNRVTAGARILGKLVFEKSAAVASSVSSVFTTTFSTNGASVHSNLANLDYASAGHTGFATSAQGALADTALQAAAIGSTIQAYDADLTTWAGVTPGTGVATALAIAVGTAGSPVVNGGAGGTPSSLTLTNATELPAAGVAGTALVAAAIGTTVQAQDATLTSLALLGTAADKLAYTTGVDTWAETAFGAAARSVLDDATVSAMVNTLGGATSTGTGGLVRSVSPTITTDLTVTKSEYLASYTATGAQVAPIVITGGPNLVIRNTSSTVETATYLTFQNYNAGGTSALAYIGAVGLGGFISDIVFGGRTGTATYAERMRLTSTGAAVTGTLAATGAVTGAAITGSGILSTTDATDATSATAASLKTAGGIAAAKGLWVGTTSRLVGNVQADGILGIGGAGVSSMGLVIHSANLTGTSQYGVRSQPTLNSSATNDGAAIYGRVVTAASSFTLTNGYGLTIPDASKGAGSSITNLYGIYIANQTQGTNNYGIRADIISGANKWNIYVSGTAQNAFAGNVRIGSVTAPTVALDVTGAALISTTLGVTGALTTNGGLQTFGANDSGGAGYRQVLVPNV